MTLANSFSVQKIGSTDYIVNDPNIAPVFSTSTDYAVGDYVKHGGLLYRFTSAHSAGAWNASHVEQIKVADVLKSVETVADNSKIINVASGAIASFPDGSNGIPVEDLVIGIEPLQDLHGYANPWPGGGSKNLAQDGYAWSIGATGLIVSADYNTSVAKVAQGETYTFSNNGVATNVGVLAFYTSFPEIGSQSYDSSRIVNAQSTFTAPIDGYAVLRLDTGTTKIQLESGSSATAWTPYANICPITGFTGANVVRTGVNLLDLDDITDNAYISNTDGSVIPYETWFASDYIPVVQGETYVMKREADGIYGTITDSNVYWALYDKDFAFVKGGINNNITIDSKVTKWIRVSSKSSYKPSGIFINTKDSGYFVTVSDYVAGNTSKLSISFGSAGTVYGGTLDVTTGLLTVDRAGYAFTGSESWTYNSDNAFFQCMMVGITSANYGKTLGSNITSNGITFKLVNDYYLRAYLSDNTGMISADSNMNNVFPNGTQLVYELKTAQSYQLTASQLTTLLGWNNIWSDTNGNVDVTYTADTGIYISDKFAELKTPVVVSGSTPSITAESGKRYVCGTVSTLAVNVPASGMVDVVFTSGSTPTVLTVSGTTVTWANGFDPTSLETDTTYELNIMDGFGVVGSWS